MLCSCGRLKKMYLFKEVIFRMSFLVPNAAKYNFVGDRGNANALQQFSGGGGQGNTSMMAGGGSGLFGDSGSAALISSLGGTPFEKGRSVIVSLSSDSRDTQLYPKGGDCTLELPEVIEGVSAVRITSAEIPHTDYNLTMPRLYFSELQDGVWIPFRASPSSGNYSIDEFVSALSASMQGATPLSGEFAVPRNTYTFAYSDDWGRMAISSNMVCDFRVQFRTKNVLVQSARISASGDLVEVVINDPQELPLSQGAGVTFTRGTGDAPIKCTVVGKSGRTFSLRIIPALLNASQQTALSEPGQTAPANYVDLVRASIQTTFGTTVPLTRILVGTNAFLAPFSGEKTDGGENDDIGSVLGFGVLSDVSQERLGASSLVSVQSPFDNPEGTVVLSTEAPHFCIAGDVVRIAGTGTLLDGVQIVEVASDETHITVVPSYQSYVDKIKYLVIFLGVTSSGAITTEPTSLDIINSIEVLETKAGTFKASIQLKDKRPFYDLTTAVGKRVVFGSDTALMPEYQYAAVTIDEVTTSAGSDYPDEMIVTIKYPTWLVQTKNATLTKVSNALLTDFDREAEYFPSTVIAPFRYDFSRRKRFVYIALNLDGKTIGNMLLPALPGKRLFARIPLPAGIDAISFLGKNDMDGTTILGNVIPRVRTVGITVYNASGRIYSFEGVDFSISLEFVATAPVQ